MKKNIVNLLLFLALLSIGFTKNLYSQTYSWPLDVIPDPDVVYTLNNKLGIGIQNLDTYAKAQIYKQSTSGGACYALLTNQEYTSSSYGFKGNIIARINYGASWSANGSGIGIHAYTDAVTRLRNNSADKTSQAGGGSFGTTITNPIPSGDASTGKYYIYGVKGSLSGSITTYPADGIVTALWAQDNIKGTNTWAGYFDGRLGVNGKIISEEVEVVSQVPWPDFVFNKEHKLRSLAELEIYIKDNNHLPEIPTSIEVHDQGLNLGEMDALLLQKIEELTLYIIQLNKDIESLKNENKKLLEGNLNQKSDE